MKNSSRGNNTMDHMVVQLGNLSPDDRLRYGALVADVSGRIDAQLTNDVAVAHIVVHEAPTKRMIRISWSDAQTGKFDQQLWIKRTAATSGVCALTGQRIKRGDQVFSPRKLKNVTPRNEKAMIMQGALSAAMTTTE